MSHGGSPSILIVEDEPDVAETYERWLQSTYATRVASNGSAALELLDESVDVVLLDRMMPELSGEEVLAEIRARGMDCRVAMVSAVDPDFDVIEMGFDAYVVKPPEKDDLVATIERLLDRASLDDRMQEYYSLVARRSALQAEKTPAELAENEAYDDLLADIETARAAVDEDLGDMTADTDFVGAVREIVPEGGSTGDDPTREGESE